MVHNETICHDVGERRLNYLKQIKCILDKLDATPCPEFVPPNPNLKPLSAYPEYQAKLTRKEEYDFPLITNVQIKEIRRTSHLEDHLHENCRNLQYIPVEFLESTHAPMDQPGRMKSVELKAGQMIPSCQCKRRDGLQDQCELQGCQNKQLCMADPAPLCGPANSLGGIESLPEDVRKIVSVPPEKCCCDKSWSKNDMPYNFECYPCSDGKGHLNR